MGYAIGFLIGVLSTLTFFYIWGSKRIKRNDQVKEVMDIYSKLQKQSKTKQMVKDNAARVASMEKAIKLLKGYDDTKN